MIFYFKEFFLVIKWLNLIYEDADFIFCYLADINLIAQNT